MSWRRFWMALADDDDVALIQATTGEYQERFGTAPGMCERVRSAIEASPDECRESRLYPVAWPLDGDEPDALPSLLLVGADSEVVAAAAAEEARHDFDAGLAVPKSCAPGERILLWSGDQSVDGLPPAALRLVVLERGRLGVWLVTDRVEHDLPDSGDPVRLPANA